jgi:predicted  nucleic acid-binding Zn ribbon protein
MKECCSMFKGAAMKEIVKCSGDFFNASIFFPTGYYVKTVDGQTLMREARMIRYCPQCGSFLEEPAKLMEKEK